MKHVPNLFTLLNLVFGSIAIVFALQSSLMVFTDGNGQQIISLPENIRMASIFIGLAAVVDFLDGFLARLLRADSAMGKQLDSLADVVSFGVAPGIILYQFLRIAAGNEVNGVDASMLGLVPAFIFPAAAAWRLATFNLDETQRYHFKGLPTPAAGLLIASMPLIFWDKDTSVAVINLFKNKWVLYAIIAITSYLMVSRIPLMSLKFKDFTIAGNMPKLVLLVIAVVAGIFLSWLAVPVIILAYILLSLAFKNKIA